MGSGPLSRRALFSLGRDRAIASRTDHAALLDLERARWEAGAPALLRALEPLAEIACDTAMVAPGDVLLDAGAGDGNVALAAARRGAVVTACDLVPEMVRQGRERAEAERLQVGWDEADVQRLPYPDARFDVAISVLGAALASRPRRTARELVRVLRSSGRLVLAAPAPRSLTGRALRLAVEGAAPAPLEWASPKVVRARVEAAAPGAEVVLRECRFELAFASEAEAWAAYEGPFGLPPSARDAFADAVSASSSAVGSVRIEEPWRLAIVRRFT